MNLTARGADPEGSGARDEPERDAVVLSQRERGIAALVAEGLTNAEIAGVLHISATTAKWHVSQLLRKLGLRGRVGLAIHAREHGYAEALQPNGASGSGTSGSGTSANRGRRMAGTNHGRPAPNAQREKEDR